MSLMCTSGKMLLNRLYFLFDPRVTINYYIWYLDHVIQLDHMMQRDHVI